MRYPVDRRRFVATAGRAVVGLIAGPMLVSGDTVRAVPVPGSAAPVPPDVFRLGVASGDPTADGVVLWDLVPEHQARAACTLAGRELSEHEWATYFPGEPQIATCAALGD